MASLSRKTKKIPVYHPDVQAYEVFDRDGSFLAVLYTDFHPREGKRSGAWMTSYKEQWIDDNGCNSRPHVSVTMNFTKPTKDKPALLTFSEVNTSYMNSDTHCTACLPIPVSKA